MALFHPRVIEKHVKKANFIPPEHLMVLSAWAKNVATGVLKRETSHDGEFIQHILIEVLGYIGSSAGEKWTVAKNQPVGEGNVDVALGYFTTNTIRIVAPLELKGSKTLNLDAIMPGRNKSPVQQAWEYAMDAKGAKWVLVSNYREIRLYAVGYGRKDYEVFDLSRLTEPEHYARFMLLLSADSLLGERTLELLKESEEKDNEITKRLYKDYKTLRMCMIDTLAKENTAIPAVDIIHITQTILDRILFVAFAEDKGLLPDGTLKKAQESQNLYNPQPVWENFKGLFNAIDKGNLQLNIPGYNGGLFASNEQINCLKISDELCEGFKKIGDYDFDSDVSVNILGHIFEQSITDLEEIKATLNPDEATHDKKNTKRKKDGIFYTPAYITRYIVEQTVGGWLNDRKSQIGFNELPELAEVDYATIQPSTRGKNKGSVTYNKKIEQHIKAWEEYKDTLSRITVLDPACGSGAFLNEVFDYLYLEGQTVNNELTTLNGGQAQLFRWDTHILANNIYGVDINRESVEITKLSLWLKTANRNEKLTYLDDNIKCGNSLIDDPDVAGDLAFMWEEEFHAIMKSGGFDVVLGNPPWGAAIKESHLERIKLQHSEIVVRMTDSYMFFVSQALQITKAEGYNGWVVPDSILYQTDNKKLREAISNNHQVKLLLNVGNAFDDVARPCAITIFKKGFFPLCSTLIGDASGTANKSLIFEEYDFEKIDSVTLSGLPNYIWPTKNLGGYKILSKCKGTLKDIVDPDDIQRGVSPDLKEAFISKRDHFDTSHLNDQFIKPTVTGGDDVKRFHIVNSNKAILYITKKTNPDKIQDIIAYISRYKHKISCTEVKQGKHPFYTLHRERDESIFLKPNKIIGVITGDRIITAVDQNILYPTDGLYIMSTKPEFSPFFVIAVLNSKLSTYFYRLLSGEIGRTLSQVKPTVLASLPFVLATREYQRPFIEKAETMQVSNKHLYDLSSRFITLVKSEFNLEKTSSKLKQWYMLEFSDFIAELMKSKVTLTVAQKAQWMEHFESKKSAALAFKTLIDTTDHMIDRMVYALYDLTPDEIAIVEKAV